MIALVLVLLRATWSVTVNPTSSYVKLGMDIVVVCRSEKNKPLKWEFNGHVLRATSGYKIEPTKDSSLLFITGIKDSMVGTYVCHDSVSSAKFHLYNIDTVIRIEGCESRNGTVGDPVMIIPCRVVVSHNITKVVVLTKDGNLIVNGEKFHVSQNRIIIHNLSFTDQGDYVLHVFAEHGITTEKTIRIDILGPPQVIFDPGNLAIGKTNNITCVALSTTDLSVTITGLEVLSCTKNLSCVDYLSFGNKCTLRASCEPSLVLSYDLWCNATNAQGKTDRHITLWSLIVPHIPFLNMTNATILSWDALGWYGNSTDDENYVTQFFLKITYYREKPISFNLTLPGANHSIDLQEYLFSQDLMGVELVACNYGVCSERTHILFSYKRTKHCILVWNTCYCWRNVVVDPSRCL